MNVFRRFWQFPQHLVGSRRFAITEACIVGLISGLAAVSLKQGVGMLGGWRIQLSDAYPDWIILPLFGLLGGWVAGFLVEQFSPAAAGSGIPQVKAAIANVPQVLNLRLAIVKLLSVVLVMGSGITLGRQGPTVQVGAALAAQLSQWIPTSPGHRRQMIASGAAAGLAAGFNAPIAGVLFVVEEFMQDFSGLTLGTAILASFIGAVVSRLLGGRTLRLEADMALYTNTFSLLDVPFFIVLGVLAGLLGALFSQGIFASLRLSRRWLPMSLSWRVSLVGLVSGIMATLLPSVFRDNTGLQEVVSTGTVGWQLLLLLFCVKFLLTLLAYGSGAPGGIFAPSLILGGALGSLVGLFAAGMEQIFGVPLALEVGISPTTTYALAGMGAFFSAVTRGPITAIVIVFEITTDFNLVLPLMIGSVVAFLVAQWLVGGSIYNHLLAMNGIDLEQRTEDGQPWRTLTAAMVLQERVETLSSKMSLSEVKEAFMRSHHRGFPVLENGRLVGIVTQSDLAERMGRFAESPGATLADIMTPQPVTVSPNTPLSDVLYVLNRFQLSRLPVTDGQRLVGIITRADIIRAESEQLSGGGRSANLQIDPAYTVYQTRSPATGKGRLLLPISNPDTAPHLMELALAIARERQYEIELLSTITLPRGQTPAEASVYTGDRRNLLDHLESLADGIPFLSIHTQIQVAHDPAQSILDAIREEHIDLLLMGWKGKTRTRGRVFGSIVDTVVRQAPCEVIVAKLSDTPQFDRWLLPIAGGPNAQAALELLPPLLTLSPDPQVRLCQVILANDVSHTPPEMLKQAAANLRRQTNARIVARANWGDSVPDVILRLSEEKHYDVIMLGASREGMLTNAIQGNIPEAIARHSTGTVLLVRDVISPS
ncbi:chloride channel protein [Vacuolonema iberomarrocanum]|uniref:chloride channel protein n=1 Tax=Vacuolonema iberomarrocanum TaxID=3454632 RepID=UPI001A0AABE1|nr:chloride channel protein [filamentous cyanobacterium LEGE 07170]